MRKWILLLMSVLLPSIVMAQKCDVLLSKKYLKDSWHCGLSVVSQPARYDWKDWVVTAGVLTATGLSFAFDDEINDIIKSSCSENFQSISGGFGILGEEYVLFPLAFGMYAISAINKDCRLRTASLAVIQTLIFTEVAVAGVKVLSCRARPDEGVGSMQWNGPFSDLSSTSFVSGHAARAFAVAAIVSGIYNNKVWVGVTAYSLATLVSCQRLVAMKHWTSDVLFGAALGYFIGRGVAKFNNRLKSIDNLTVIPFSDGYGIGVALKF